VGLVYFCGEGLARTKGLRTKWGLVPSLAPHKTVTALLYGMQNAVDTNTATHSCTDWLQIDLWNLPSAPQSLRKQLGAYWPRGGLKSVSEMEPGQTNWPVTWPDPVALDPATRPDPTRIKNIHYETTRQDATEKKQSLKVSQHLDLDFFESCCFKTCSSSYFRLLCSCHTQLITQR